MTSKEQVRKQLLTRRASLSVDEVEGEAAALAERVLAVWDEVHTGGGGRVATYFSYDREPATGTIVGGLLKRGVEVIVPIVLPRGVLEWTRYAGAEATEPNRYGIEEPTGARLGPEAVGTADLVVVPGLAVDAHGRRLGRGGGFYDRALAYVPESVPRVIVLHEGEILDEVPHEPHDQRVDIAVTPTRTVRLG